MTLTPRKRRLLEAAGLVFVTYKSVREALTEDAGLISGPAGSTVVAVALCAALLLSRRLPLTVAAMALAGFLLESQVWPVLVALYAVTVRQPPRYAIALTAAAFVPAWYGPFRELVNMPLVTYLPCAVLIVPVAFGLAARSHRDLARSLAAELDHLEAANRLRDDRVRLAERARIAREMHDVLAHRLSLLVLHTGVLQRRATEVPEPVRERLGQLRETGAHALDDLRDLLGALRDEDGPAPLTPTADDLPALVAAARAAGTPVEAELGELAPLPAAVRLAAHRIVQEALTNARKHAPGRPVSLAVAVDRARVTIRVTNPAPDADPEPGHRGYGLIGIAERVAALHGRLSHRRADGRFELRAELPVPTHPQDAEAGLAAAGAVSR
ncbi:sensor histidine kinase [Streptomyces boninensis]|uniref:sensor histidine kinase n=1 Tax=Streptomyces boninensis TaxID=2039455 RepID=UPI003B2209A3